MPPYPLTNFEIQKYYQHEPNLNRVYSRNNLPKIKDDTYVMNLDEYEQESIGQLCMCMVINVTYFESFAIEHIPKKIGKFIGTKNITTNIYRI